MWLFLIILQAVHCLNCYKSYQLIAAEGAVTDKATTTQNYSYGFCVTIRRHNGTHKVVERDFWRAARLPLECHYYKRHCFPLKSSKWRIAGCCCPENLCNENEDALYMQYPMVFNPTWWNWLLIKLRASVVFVASQTIPVWVTILTAIGVYWLTRRVEGKPPDEENPSLEGMTEPSLILTCPFKRPSKKETPAQGQQSPGDAALKTTIKKKSSKKSSILSQMKSPLKTPLKSLLVKKTPARPEAKASQSPGKKSVLSQMTGPLKGLKKTPLKSPARSETKKAKPSEKKKDPTPKKTPPMTPKKTSTKAPAEAKLTVAQSPENKARSPIKGIQQKKPEKEIVLPNGRVQKISMDFEEGDEEWEE